MKNSTAVKSAWKKVAEHSFVGIVLLWSLTWAPSFVSHLRVVDAVIEDALEWAAPDEEEVVADTEDPTLVERAMGVMSIPVEAAHSVTYNATLFTTKALARVVVWALTFVLFLGWGLLELRWALTSSLTALPTTFFAAIKVW